MMKTIIIVALVYWALMAYMNWRFIYERHLMCNLYFQNFWEDEEDESCDGDDMDSDKMAWSNIKFELIVIFVESWIAPIFLLRKAYYCVPEFLRSWYYRDRPCKLDENWRKYFSEDKDFVKDYNKQFFLSIDIFNHLHKTSYTLKQIYGKDYVTALTDEEKRYFARNYKYGVVRLFQTARENIYTHLAEKMAVGIASYELDSIEECFTDDVEMIECGVATMYGKKEVMGMFAKICELNRASAVFSDLAVRFSGYCRHECLMMKKLAIRQDWKTHNSKRIILFDVEGDKISRLYMPVSLDYDNSFRNVSHKVNAESYLSNNLIVECFGILRYVDRHILKSKKTLMANHMPCVECGRPASELDFKVVENADISGPGYSESIIVTECPHCQRTVECFSIGSAYTMYKCHCEDDEDGDFDEKYIYMEKAVVGYEHERDFASILNEFHKYIYELLEFPLEDAFGLPVTWMLPSLKVKKGWTINFSGPYRFYNEDVSVSVSQLYAENEGGIKDYDYLNYVFAPPTRVGAWEVYLLCTAYACLPTCWHGVREARYFVTTDADVKEIEKLSFGEVKVDASELRNAGKLCPEVTVDDNVGDGDYVAHVYCTYWSQWKGLVRENAKIVIANRKVKLFDIVDTEILYEYDCGLLACVY